MIAAIYARKSTDQNLRGEERSVTRQVEHAPAGRDGMIYLTPQQVAELLQVSSKTVYRWASQDATFPVLRVGGVVRFPRERMLRWLRDREQGRPRRRRSPGERTS